MIIAILGIGEAGYALASDLLAAGVAVRGWDPKPKHIPAGMELADSNADAVQGAEVILSVNWASVAIEVAREVAPVLVTGQLYADLNTASPQNKRAVAAIIKPTGALFVDTALMAPVLPKGLQTPIYVSGSGAQAFFERMSSVGMSITVLDDEAGNAATHKLIRSVMYKGVAAVVMECLEAAEAFGLESYARAQIMTLLKDEAMIDRFVKGSKQHAQRRQHEMEAVVELLDSVGVSPFTSRASIDKLKELFYES